MKKLRVLSAFMVLFTAIGFVSCDSEPVDPLLLDNEGEQPTGPAIFKVDFSGSTFTATTAQAVVGDGVIAIMGIRGTNGESVSLALPGSTTGTYSGDEVLMVYSPTAASEYQFANIDNELASNGSVVITSINTTNHTISGTFSFTGHWSDTEANLPSIAFTNGSFQNIPYTGTIIDPNDEEYMRALVDGVEKEYGIIASLAAGENVSFSGTIVSPMSSMQIMVPANITPGTYPLGGGPFEGPVAIYHNNPEGFPYNATSGSITIISNSGGWIEGEFEFTGTDADDNTVEVTDGEFNIELP
jgi:hypothetical protein